MRDRERRIPQMRILHLSRGILGSQAQIDGGGCDHRGKQFIHRMSARFGLAHAGSQTRGTGHVRQGQAFVFRFGLEPRNPETGDERDRKQGNEH